MIADLVVLDMHVFVHLFADRSVHVLSFFFNDPATTEIYTLSLHDALPISGNLQADTGRIVLIVVTLTAGCTLLIDRKSTRLNSSHMSISYAVFCLKKKKGATSKRTIPVIIKLFRAISATANTICLHGNWTR